MIKILTFSLICLLFLSCNALKPKKVDTRENPINAMERARKNINEGKGTSLKDLVGRGKTTYEFSTSNPMWRASLEILDWYAENNSSESIKITVRFLANEIRSDSLKVSVHKRVCKSDNDCRINLLNSSEIGNELRSSIIRKAAIIEKESKKKK